MIRSKLDHSRARIAYLERLADDPRLSPEQQRISRHLLVSQHAAIRLRVRALAAGSRSGTEQRRHTSPPIADAMGPASNPADRFAAGPGEHPGTTRGRESRLRHQPRWQREPAARQFRRLLSFA
jgi:hypothetical protein